MTYKHFRGALPPWLAAGFAAGIGIAFCYKALWWTWSKAIGARIPHSSIERYAFMAAPFLIGAVIAAAAYVLLVRRDDVREVAERVGEGMAKIAARLTPTVQRIVPQSIVPQRDSTGARTMFFSMVGGSAVIGALLAALFYSLGADGSPPDGLGETVGATLAGGIQGAIVGVGFGLVLAAPTAIIVWFLGRGRR
jgi:hypothetical protein